MMTTEKKREKAGLLNYKPVIVPNTHWRNKSAFSRQRSTRARPQ